MSYSLISLKANLQMGEKIRMESIKKDVEYVLEVASDILYEKGWNPRMDLRPVKIFEGMESNNGYSIRGAIYLAAYRIFPACKAQAMETSIYAIDEVDAYAVNNDMCESTELDIEGIESGYTASLLLSAARLSMSVPATFGVSDLPAE